MNDQLTGLVSPGLPTLPPPVIVPGPAPTLLFVSVSAPNGGELYQPGQQVNILWSSSGASQHTVKFAADGVNFVDISPTLSGTAQSFLWTVPQQLTAAGRIRVAVRDTLDNRVTDDSNGTFTIAPPAAPQITSITPGNGSTNGGTTVTITGFNFVAGSRARFGGVDAATTVINSNQLTAVTPAGAAGFVTVRVVNPDGQVAIVQNGFEYRAVALPAPQITSIAPGNGSTNGGTTVTITGFNFVAGSRARFGGVDAATTVINSNQLTAITPAGAAGVVTVRVVNPDGQAAIVQNGFEYRAVALPAPVIASITPGNGPVAGGTTVTITGDNFVAGAVAKFGGVDALSTTVMSRTLVTAITPPGTAGLVTVRVVNPDGQAGIRQNGFEYRLPPVPSIASIEPGSGPQTGGTRVTVSGFNFMPGAIVRFGTMDAASTTFPNPNDLTRLEAVTAPTTQLGFVAVRVINPDGQVGRRDNGFNFMQAPPPMIATITPKEGSTNGGTTVTITGDNFVSGTVAKFGGVNALSTTVMSRTQLTAVTPPGAAGLVTVRAVNPDGQAAIVQNGFEYKAPVALPAPVITTITPREGSTNGGTTVTITGDNFVNGAVAKFGGVNALSTTVMNKTQLTAVTPPGAAGLVTVRVVNPDGQAAIVQNGFEYKGAPVMPRIDTVSPMSGPLAGNNSVTIGGANFLSGARVAFGGVDAVIESVMLSQIRVKVPPSGNPGFVNVAVTNPGGMPVEKANAYQYAGALTDPGITAVEPNMGPTGGGTEVIIRGRNFRQGVQVFFNDVKIQNMRYVSMQELRVFTPPRATPGVVDVVVRNADGSMARLVNGFTYTQAGTQEVGARILSVQVIDPDQDPEDPAPLSPQDLGSGTIKAGEKVEFVGEYEGGFGAYTVKPEMTGLPAGATVSFMPPQPERGEDCRITVTTSADNTPPGMYRLEVGGTVVRTLPDGTTQQFPVQVKAFYNLTVQPPVRRVKVNLGLASATVAQGGMVEIPVTIKRKNFDGRSVTFRAANLPGGVTAEFDPGTTTGNTTMLRLLPGAAADIGTFTVRISVMGDGLTDIVPALLSLVVRQGQGSTLTLVATPLSNPVDPGDTATFDISLSDPNFDQPVTLRILSVSDTSLPAPSLGFNPIFGGQKSQLTVPTTNETTTDGTVTVIGETPDGTKVGPLDVKYTLLSSVKLAFVSGPVMDEAADGMMVTYQVRVLRTKYNGDVKVELTSNNAGLGAIPPQIVKQGMDIATFMFVAREQPGNAADPDEYILEFLASGVNTPAPPMPGSVTQGKLTRTLKVFRKVNIGVRFNPSTLMLNAGQTAGVEVIVDRNGFTGTVTLKALTANGFFADADFVTGTQTINLNFPADRTALVVDGFNAGSTGIDVTATGQGINTIAQLPVTVLRKPRVVGGIIRRGDIGVDGIGFESVTAHEVGEQGGGIISTEEE